jgi:hypothetical protein
MKSVTHNFWHNQKNLYTNFKSKHLKFLLILFVFSLILGCASSGTGSSSAERQAKLLTSEMQEKLNLNEDQAGKVLLINVVNLGLKAKLKEGDSQRDVQARYDSEMKKILSETQYKLFVENFLK